MAVTILTTPYVGLTPKLNTIYNGLPFVVDSNRKLVNNFKYICEVSVDGNKITELRHNGDISDNNNGIFDVGRVIQNYIGYDLNPFCGADVTYNAINSCRLYDVKFGEEFTRIQGVKTIGYSSYGTRITFNGIHNLKVGDRILVSGSNVSVYNGYKSVLYAASDYVMVGTTFTTVPTNLSQISVIEGEKIVTFGYTLTNGVKYLALNVSLNGTGLLTYSRLSIGDTILISQDTVQEQYYENTEWQVSSIQLVTIGSIKYAKITTTATYQGTTPTGSGSVVSKNNYVIKNQINTTGDNSYTFNGVLQYHDYLSWTPTPYIFKTATQSTTYFLTKKSIREVDVDTDDYYTLNTFGTKQNPVLTAYGTFVPMLETWSTPSHGVINGTASQENNVISAGSTTMKIQVSSVLDYGIGDFVTVTVPALFYTGNCRVVRVSGGYIYLDLSFTTGSPLSCTIVQTIKVRQRSYGSMKASMNILGCGPKNIYKTYGANEITDGSCYKYFVWIGKYRGGSYQNVTQNFDIWSERFVFNVKTNCSKYKKYRLTWLNELGGFDYYTFNLRSDKSLSVTRDMYTKKLKYGTGDKYGYSNGDRGRTNYHTTSTEGYIVRSNWLNQEELDWIRYIYESPEVYWIEEDTQRIHPVNLKSSDVILPQVVNRYDNGGLYTYEIEFISAYDRTVQGGGNIKNAAVANSIGGGWVYRDSWVTNKIAVEMTNQWYNQSRYE